MKWTISDCFELQTYRITRSKWQSIPGCEIDKEALLSFKLEAGDILIARTGGTIGKSFLVNELPVVAVFASYLIRVQVSHEIYDRFLKFFMESPIYWMQLQDWGKRCRPAKRKRPDAWCNASPSSTSRRTTPHCRQSR